MRPLTKTSRSSRRSLGGSSIEYIAILALVVIPIALMAPMFYGMIKTYTNRIAYVIRLPLG